MNEGRRSRKWDLVNQTSRFMILHSAATLLNTYIYVVIGNGISLFKSIEKTHHKGQGGGPDRVELNAWKSKTVIQR